MHDIIKASIFAAIGVLVFASLLVPVVSDAMTENGEPITITNNSPIVLRTAEPGDILECVRTVSDGVTTDNWTLNGEAVVGPTGSADTWNVGIASDGLYMSVNAPANAAIGSWYAMSASTPVVSYLSGGGNNGASYGFVFSEDTITIYGAYSSDTPTLIITAPYTWAYVVCPYADGEYCAPLAGGVGVVKANTDIIVCGAYTSGDLDTMYYHYNGVDYVGNSAYDMTMNVTKSLHAGTTDIYDATVSVTITDGNDSETFTPYRIFVPYQVTGHQTSGALYDMLGVLPIAVIVVLIFGVLGAALYSRIE